MIYLHTHAFIPVPLLGVEAELITGFKDGAPVRNLVEKWGGGLTMVISTLYSKE